MLSSDEPESRAGGAPHRPALRLAGLAPWVLAMAGCAGASGGAPASGEPEARDVGAISEISLERDCFGCETGSRLVLHRDGRAELTITGKPRRGTADRHLRGRISPQDFEALAGLALAQGFFDLAAVYDLPDLQDGAWATTAVTRAGERKEIFRREDAAPAALQRIEAAIAAWQAGVRFEPVQAGR